MRQRDRLIGHDVSLEAGSSSQRGRTAHLPVNVRRLGSAGQDYLRAGKRGEGCPNLENKYCVWISLRIQREWTGGDLHRARVLVDTRRQPQSAQVTRQHLGRRSGAALGFVIGGGQIQLGLRCQRIGRMNDTVDRRRSDNRACGAGAEISIDGGATSIGHARAGKNAVGSGRAKVDAGRRPGIDRFKRADCAGWKHRCAGIDQGIALSAAIEHQFAAEDGAVAELGSNLEEVRASAHLDGRRSLKDAGRPGVAAIFLDLNDVVACTHVNQDRVVESKIVELEGVFSITELEAQTVHSAHNERAGRAIDGGPICAGDADLILAGIIEDDRIGRGVPSDHQIPQDNRHRHIAREHHARLQVVHHGGERSNCLFDTVFHSAHCSICQFMAQKKPTRRNALRHSTASAYSSMGHPAKTGVPFI